MRTLPSVSGTWPRDNSCGTFPAHDFGAQAVGLSPDGKHIVSGGWGGGVRLWETATGRSRALVEDRRRLLPAARAAPGPAAGPNVDAVAYAPDGATFAATDQQHVVVWNSATGKELWRHKPGTRLLAIAYAPDGRTLATGSDTGLVRVYETSTGTQRSEFTVKAVPVLFVAFSPTGRLLAVGGGGRRGPPARRA